MSTMTDGFLEKTGTWYSYKGERLGQGRDNVKRLFKENVPLAGQVEAEVRKKVGLVRDEGGEKKPAAKER